MTDVYTQENGSKKKFLAPVLVILLCMVSLTAAGYAYSATIDNTDDKGDITGLSMSLKDTSGDDVIAALYDFKVMYGTHTVNGKAVYYDGGVGFLENGTAAEYVAPASPTGFKGGYYVESDIDDTPANIEVYDEAGAELTAIQTAAGLSGKLLDISVVYKVGEDYTLNVINKTGGAVAVSVSASDLELNGVKLIAVFKETTTIVDTVVISDAADQIGENIADGAEKNYTVSLYAVSIDYWSATANVLDEESVAFAIHFSGAEA